MGYILKWPAQFLDGNILLSDSVVSCTHDSLGPGPDGFEVLVSFEDCEPGVPDLDGVEMR